VCKRTLQRHSVVLGGMFVQHIGSSSLCSAGAHWPWTSGATSFSLLQWQPCQHAGAGAGRVCVMAVEC
jgi:hypothetical protein